MLRSQSLGRTGPSIPDHTLLHPIGHGAYGEVWLARNVVGTLRAVKVVHRADFSEVHPFEREFKGIQKFEPVSRSHPGFVDILQIGRNDAEGYFYYVMELADGVGTDDGRPRTADGTLPMGAQRQRSDVEDQKLEVAQGVQQSDLRPLTSGLQSPPSTPYCPRTLRSELRACGRLPVEECVRIALALADALAHLHRAGLVHRDIKPSNIIFVDGAPQLADIGLVANVDEARSFVGTEGFIPPEGPGSAQADVFSLGKVLYEMSMGRSRLDFPALPADWDALPEVEQEQLAEFNAVLMKACEVDLTRRYCSAEELCRDLEGLQQGRSIRRQRAMENWSRHGRRVFLGASALVVLTMAVLPLLRERTLSTPTPAPAKVFVLPFRHDGTNGNGGEMAGRMTDAFINSLKQINGVTVAQRRSALGDRPLAEARAEAARLFDVRYVLTGRLKADNDLTLSLDLLETGRELPVWLQTFTGTTNRLIELEEQALRALAVSLHTSITPETARRIGQVLTNNLVAWKLVEQGVQDFFLQTRVSFDAALQRYHTALDFDPDYLEAWSRKAQLYRELVVDDHPRRVWPEIKACAERMLLIDPTFDSGQHYLWSTQVTFEWEWLRGEATFRERRARGADGPIITALYLRMLGRTNEARIEQSKLTQLNQTNPYVRNHTAAALFVERDYRRVLEEADKTDAILGQPGTAGDWRFHAHYQLGQFNQALEAVRVLRKLRDAPARMALEACALAKLGQRDEALEILGKLEAMPGFGRYVDPYPLAWVHLALGDRHAALAKLKQACHDRSEWVVFTDEPGGLRTDPKLDELRNEPEFQELLKLAGLDVWPK